MAENPQIAAEQEKLDEILKQQREALQGNNQIQLETENLTGARDKVRVDISDAEAALIAAETDLDTATVARSNMLAKLAEVTDQIGPATAELESIKKATDDARAAAIASNADIQATQDKIIADAQAAVDTLTAEKAELEAQVAPISDQVSRLTNQVTALNVQIVTLNATIDAANAQLLVLAQKQSVINDSINDLQAKADALAADIASKTAASAVLDGSIAEKTATIADLDSQIATLTETLKTDNEYNAEFLQARAGLQAAQVEVDQRLAYLKQKYGDLGEPW